MPQLRDSGTRSLHATEPVPSAEMDGFCRIFGVETEYGVAVTGAERPVDAGQVAMTMFQPIVSRSRSGNRRCQERGTCNSCSSNYDR